MKYLFVVAHPDDESLGAGAFIYDSIKKGHEVSVVIANGIDDIDTRDNMISDMNKSHSILGITRRKLLSFHNLELSFVAPKEIVPIIEDEIMNFKPDYIFTHWEGDINPDHKAVCEFTKQAARYTQRHERGFVIKGLFSMEVLSSTNWDTKFTPDTFIEVSEEAVNSKIESLKVYKNVLRNNNHTRSAESIKALATYRGTSVGVKYAEGIKTYWRIK